MQRQRIEGFRQTSPLMAVPSKLKEFRGDPIAALFAGRKMWIQTYTAYYSVQLKCPELIATVAKYSAKSPCIEIKVSHWRWVDDEVIDLLSRNPIFVEAD